MTKKYIESKLDTSKYRLRVVHLHSGNSTRKERHGHKYMTIAIISDKSTGEIFSKGVAQCSKMDPPRRSVGRQVAVGRALADLDDLETCMFIYKPTATV